MFRPLDSLSTALSLDLWDRHYCNINWKAANKPFSFLPSFFAHPSKSSSSTKKKRHFWRRSSYWRAPCYWTQILILFDMDVVSLAFLKERVFWYKDLPLYLVFGWRGFMKFRSIDVTSNYIFVASLSAFWVSPLGSEWISISQTNNLMSLLFSFRKHKNGGSEPLWSLGQRVCT